MKDCLFPEYADIWSLILVVGKKKMKDIQLSAIHKWWSVRTETIRSVQNSVPNVLPNDYVMSEEKSKAKTVRRKLRMANSNADISQSHKIMLEKGNDTGSWEWKDVKLLRKAF